ncbi:RidA family protein [Flavobacterium sp.]|jgi:enamine deaminase RidA (YjgF/YER057c/UK114 family)|uniref:RidA family protein n=1 Tax=Flavobacterium sp. TaxID=239 RepID=UPI0037C18511
MFKKEYLEPNAGFSQVVKVETKETITLYISGQIGSGSNLEEQSIATFKNMDELLKTCKASFQDVVKMNTYIVNFNPEIDLPIFRKVRRSFLGETDYPASTLVGVSVLGNREWLIEIEAIAVISKL